MKKLLCNILIFCFLFPIQAGASNKEVKSNLEIGYGVLSTPFYNANKLQNYFLALEGLDKFRSPVCKLDASEPMTDEFVEKWKAIEKDVKKLTKIEEDYVNSIMESLDSGVSYEALGLDQNISDEDMADLQADLYGPTSNNLSMANSYSSSAPVCDRSLIVYDQQKCNDLKAATSQNTNDLFNQLDQEKADLETNAAGQSPEEIARNQARKELGNQHKDLLKSIQDQYKYVQDNYYPCCEAHEADKLGSRDNVSNVDRDGFELGARKHNMDKRKEEKQYLCGEIPYPDLSPPDNGEDNFNVLLKHIVSRKMMGQQFTISLGRRMYQGMGLFAFNSLALDGEEEKYVVKKLPGKYFVRILDSSDIRSAQDKYQSGVQEGSINTLSNDTFVFDEQVVDVGVDLDLENSSAPADLYLEACFVIPGGHLTSSRIKKDFLGGRVKARFSLGSHFLDRIIACALARVDKDFKVEVLDLSAPELQNVQIGDFEIAYDLDIPWYEKAGILILSGITFGAGGVLAAGAIALLIKMIVDDIVENVNKVVADVGDLLNSENGEWLFKAFVWRNNEISISATFADYWTAVQPLVQHESADWGYNPETPDAPNLHDPNAVGNWAWEVSKQGVGEGVVTVGETIQDGANLADEGAETFANVISETYSPSTQKLTFTGLGMEKRVLEDIGEFTTTFKKHVDFMKVQKVVGKMCPFLKGVTKLLYNPSSNFSSLAEDRMNEACLEYVENLTGSGFIAHPDSRNQTCYSSFFDPDRKKEAWWADYLGQSWLRPYENDYGCRIRYEMKSSAKEQFEPLAQCMIGSINTQMNKITYGTIDLNEEDKKQITLEYDNFRECINDASAEVNAAAENYDPSDPSSTPPPAPQIDCAPPVGDARCLKLIRQFVIDDFIDLDPAGLEQKDKEFREMVLLLNGAPSVELQMELEKLAILEDNLPQCINECGARGLPSADCTNLCQQQIDDTKARIEELKSENEAQVRQRIAAEEEMERQKMEEYNTRLAEHEAKREAERQRIEDEQYNLKALNGGNGYHTREDCESYVHHDAKGVYSSDCDCCKFKQECPAGWTQTKNWSDLPSKYCNTATWPCGGRDCSTGGHRWANEKPDTCSYRKTKLWCSTIRNNTCSNEGHEDGIVGCH